MSLVKLPYYPQLEATLTETRFGVPEVSNAEIYENSIPNKIILKCDCLDCLRKYFDDSVYIYRDVLYDMISGNTSDLDCQRVLATLYKRHKSVTAFVNELYTFGDNGVPLVNRCLAPLRDKVNAYRKSLHDNLKSSGGKYLVESKYIMYYAFSSNGSVPEIEGASIIC